MSNRKTPIKKRSAKCFARKCEKLEKWYNRLLKFREREIINSNTKQPTKRKELKSLETYIEKIKKPLGD